MGSTTFGLLPMKPQPDTTLHQGLPAHRAHQDRAEQKSMAGQGSAGQAPGVCGGHLLVHEADPPPRHPKLTVAEIPVRAAIGQVWTRHCRSSRACPTAFIALSVHHVFIRPLAPSGGGGGLPLLWWAAVGRILLLTPSAPIVMPGPSPAESGDLWQLTPEEWGDGVSAS